MAWNVFHFEHLDYVNEILKFKNIQNPLSNKAGCSVVFTKFGVDRTTMIERTLEHTSVSTMLILYSHAFFCILSCTVLAML